MELFDHHSHMTWKIQTFDHHLLNTLFICNALLESTAQHT